MYYIILFYFILYHIIYLIWMWERMMCIQIHTRSQLTLDLHVSHLHLWIQTGAGEWGFKVVHIPTADYYQYFLNCAGICIYIYICINTYIHAHNISYIHIWCVHTWVNGWVLCYVSYIPNSWLLCGNVCLSKVPNIEFRWTRYRESEIAEPHYIILQYMLNCKDPRCWINRPQIDRVTRPGLFARLRILKVRLRCCRQLLGPWHSRVRI